MSGTSPDFRMHTSSTEVELNWGKDLGNKTITMSLILGAFTIVESIFLIVRVSSHVCITFPNDPSKEGLEESQEEPLPQESI